MNPKIFRRARNLGIFLLLLFLIVQEALLPSFIPSFAATKSSYRPSDLLVTSRQGKVIYQKRISHKVRRLEWLETSALPKSLVESFLHAEDKRFFWHFGVDPLAVLVAFTDYIKNGKLRGASTITMQTVDLIENQLTLAGRKKGLRTFSHKLQQMAKALLLEWAWTKPQILEAYLNLLPFSGELQGLRAASYGLFNQSPFSLGVLESSLLAAMVRAPNDNSFRRVMRACWILNDIDANRDCQDLYPLAAKIKSGYKISLDSQRAIHVAHELVRIKRKNKFWKQRGVLGSSIDLELQLFVQDFLKDNVLANKSQNMNDGAAIVIHNKTGEVLAYVGNIGKDSSAPYVDGAKAFRQVGSTLKPFVYGVAFDHTYLTASSYLSDTPLEVVYSSGNYTPQNYDKTFRGPVTVRVALASSLNIPAVRAIQLVGPDRVLSLLKKMDLARLKSSKYYGPALALGGVDLSLREMSNAYRALANGGVWSPLQWQIAKDRVNKKIKSVPILSQAASFIIANILSDRASRQLTFGLENSLSTPFWTAVKTGTSKDMRDNWCLGFSDTYTVGVWSGNFDGSAMWNVSGVHGAAPVWMGIMKFLHRNQVSKPPHPPVNVVSKNIKFSIGGRISDEQTEWYIKGSEPLRKILSPIGQVMTRIVHPTDGAQFALDPDLPVDRNRILIQLKRSEYNTSKQKLSLRLNGRALNLKNSQLAWLPKPGRQLLTLVDGEGHILQQVHFRVRN